MNRCSVIYAVMLTGLAFGIVEQAHGNIGPEIIAKMKRSATDVFQIEVVDVKVDNSKAVKRRTLIKAKIVAVKRSGGRPTSGELIEIHSYQLFVADAKDPKELVDAVVAPKAPAPLKRGWKGTVYLKVMDVKGDIKQYGIAAFGFSFEPAGTATVKPSRPR